MTTKEQIIKLYKDKKNWVAPSQSWIAREVGCAKSYVHKVISNLK